MDKSKILQVRIILMELKVFGPSKINTKVKNIYAICGVMDPHLREKIYQQMKF